jgi:superfamily II DNA or RNA helicase
LNPFVPGDFPNRIRHLRAKLGLTQMQLAEVLGVSFPTVNRWENAKSRPSALAWQRVVRLERQGGDADVHASGQAPPDHGTTPEGVPTLDFSADPEIIRVVAEGWRLTYGHLFNPTFATETSLIDPLPHQLLAVYEHMLVQPRLRFLLADDAGAGKTIMAGLYIREMLARRLIRRVLVVPPAGLIGNWVRELHRLFSLPFRVVAGSEARTGNPFVGPDSDLLVISVDTLAGERMFARLQEPSVTPYDLVIFDEAHKLSADREPDFRVHKTERYRLAEALAGVWNDDSRWQLSWRSLHLLLLTATPHMGKDFPYYCLWRLLEPEALSTFSAFESYPPEARQRHFLRRAKEEMVRFDGSPIYPMRISDTQSYELSQGATSEQALYDETTRYIQQFYSRARILNRSAAQLAMSVFQRRLASSTYALLRSMERRLAKLDGLVDDIRSGRITIAELLAHQRRLDKRIHDVFEETTPDEEQAEGGREQNEAGEDQVLGGVVALSLAELESERLQVQSILSLARQVYDPDQGQESKFAKLYEIIRDPRFQEEKILIFTEHRDTLAFLVRRLESLGFTGQVARIHGGMDTRPDPETGLSERDAQVEFFRKANHEGGARFLVATDAAGEGINLQFCWLMVNYDIPWNPARLEQRMGRIHRYGQKHDPVVILNLVAGATREGRVLKTLLDKLERIRRELGSDKVFDVIGRLFEGVSLKEYMDQTVTEEGAQKALIRLDGRLTTEQVQALKERERRLFADGGDVASALPRLQAKMGQDVYCHLLPGYVRGFVKKAAPLVNLAVDGDLDGLFSLRALEPGALDPLWPLLEAYPPALQNRLTVYRPAGSSDEPEAIFLHPGEPLFDRFNGYTCARLARQALRGGIFVDPSAQQPYMFHLALVSVERQSDPARQEFCRQEALDYRLVGLRQDEARHIEPCPVEHLLLLKGGHGVSPVVLRFATLADDLRERAAAYGMERIARPLAEQRRHEVLAALPEREDFLRRGYDYQDAELAAARSRFTEQARAGHHRAKGELTKVKERQRTLLARREEALASLRQEPDLIAPGDVAFLAHALVLPSSDPEDRKRQDEAIEAMAVGIAWAYEEGNGALVNDVSTPDRACAAGLTDCPGFDLISRRPDGRELAIEVKGRAGIGEIELTENEWARCCNLRSRYWLYVVYDCASSQPRLHRVQDPFWKLLVRAKGGVVIDNQEILAAAET